MPHTALYRGALITYRVVDDHLQVYRIDLGLSYRDEKSARAGTGPLLDGVPPHKELHTVCRGYFDTKTGEITKGEPTEIERPE